MISLSSIVKARLLTNAPKGKEYHREKNELHHGARTRIAMEDLNAKRDSIIEQALKKSAFIEKEAKNRADLLIEEAQRSSMTIMEGAEKRGYEEGYRQGLIDGEKAAQLEAQKGLQEIQALVQLLEEERRLALEQQEKELIKIAFQLTKKIIKQQAHRDENMITTMIEEALHGDDSQVKVYLSQYQSVLDLRLDKSIIKKIQKVAPNAKVVLLKEADKIMVESEDGVVDMSIPLQLNKLETALGEELD
jgi:flagellar assembly protein FliH